MTDTVRAEPVEAQIFDMDDLNFLENLHVAIS
jgi:hypothetical protein